VHRRKGSSEANAQVDGVYAIECNNVGADYADSPIHAAWGKKWEQSRENSVTFQISDS